MAECEFCSSVLKNEALLSIHKKTAKYCLKIQEEKSIQITNNKKYKCEYCKKELTQLGNLKTHYNICIEKRIFDISSSYENKIKENQAEFESKIKIIEAEFEKKLESQKNHYETIILIDRNKHSTEIKCKNELIHDIKRQLTYSRNSKEKLLIDKSDKSNTTNVTNSVTTINNVNVIGSIDFSQERFDQIVSEKLTYDLFQKGSYAGKQLLVSYFTDELGILRIEMVDDARNKLKIIDKETGRSKIIDHITLFGRFSNSETLHKYLKDHKNKYCNSTNYTVQGGIQLTKKILSFQEEKRFTNTVYKYFKSHVREFGQLVTLNEVIEHNEPMLTNLFEEEKS